VPHFAASIALSKRHRNRRLMDIQPDQHDILQLVSPPFLRLGASQSGATLKGERRGRDPQTSQLIPTALCADFFRPFPGRD
jgi:hypothetical protein